MANATGADNQNGGTSADSDNEPKYLTAEEATTLIGNVVNQAITAHSKRNETTSAEAIRRLLQEELSKVVTPKSDDGGEPPSAGSKKPDPESVAMRRKIEEMEAKLKASDERAAAAERKGREERARADLVSQLGPVREELKPVLSEYLFHRVAFDEDGTPLLKVGEDALPLKDGVASFLKSKEAAVFLPPPGGGGAGSSAGGGAGKKMGTGARKGDDGMPRYDREATTDEEKAQRAYEREQAYLAQQRSQNL